MDWMKDLCRAESCSKTIRREGRCNWNPHWYLDLTWISSAANASVNVSLQSLFKGGPKNDFFG